MRRRIELTERNVHRSCGGVSHVWEDVRIDVEGKAYIGVAYKLLHELGVYALPQ